MSIQQGDSVPRATFKQLTATGIVDVSTEALLMGRKVAMFGLPGACTPVCSMSRLPGYIRNAENLRAAESPWTPGKNGT